MGENQAIFTDINAFLCKEGFRILNFHGLYTQSDGQFSASDAVLLEYATLSFELRSIGSLNMTASEQIEPGLLELLQLIVRIPSVNPMDEDDPEVCGESRMGSFFAAYLRVRGFRVEEQDVEPGRPNVVGTIGPEDASRTLLVEAHLDTVSVRGMTVPPFAAEVRDGRLYGRGACDMKGPMAAFLWTLQPDLLSAIAASGKRLVVVGAMGEEQGCEGIQVLVDGGRLSADEALVLEPTELNIVHAHKGAFWVRVHVEGRSGHGSNPAGGISAIAGMTRFIERLEKSIEDLPIESSVLGRPTLNVGKIVGGSGVNLVPGTCTIEIDRRTLPSENHAEILEGMRAELEALKTEGRITGFEIEAIKDSRAYQTATESGLIHRLSEACSDQGVTPRCAGTAWYSDAGPLAQVCSETVVFGPGSIKQAHTPDEYIDLVELQKGADILAAFLRRTGGAV